LFWRWWGHTRHLPGPRGAVGLAQLPAGPIVVSPTAVVIAFIVSAGSASSSAFIRRRKASRLDPIEALRFE